jgi:small basic protein
MIYVIAGVILGVLAGFNLNLVYSPDYAVYISLAVLAILNTIFNLLTENLKGELTPIKSMVFLISDLGFGLLLGYVGEQLGLPIYLAAVFAFGNNIYKNLRIMSNFMLEKYNKNK